MAVKSLGWFYDILGVAIVWGDEFSFNDWMDGGDVLLLFTYFEGHFV